jgi:hypothetical protein
MAMLFPDSASLIEKLSRFFAMSGARFVLGSPAVPA